MSITLHQASEELRELLGQIDPETGEAPLGFEAARAVVERKTVATVAYLLEATKHADMADEYAKDLLLRVKAERKRIEWLKTYLREHMAATGILKITDERGVFQATLAPGRDKSVDVFDAEQLPDDYMRLVPAKVEPDKRLIASALDDGFDVPGARYVLKDRLTIK